MITHVILLHESLFTRISSDAHKFVHARPAVLMIETSKQQTSSKASRDYTVHALPQRNTASCSEIHRTKICHSKIVLSLKVTSSRVLRSALGMGTCGSWKALRAALAHAHDRRPGEAVSTS